MDSSEDCITMKHVSSVLDIGGGELLGELIALFESTAASKVGEIRAAADAGDLEAVRKIAHGLRSSSTHLGAHLVTALAKEIELSEETAQHEWLAAAIDRLEAEIGAAATRLREIAAGRDGQ